METRLGMSKTRQGLWESSEVDGEAVSTGATSGQEAAPSESRGEWYMAIRSPPPLF